MYLFYFFMGLNYIRNFTDYEIQMKLSNKIIVVIKIHKSEVAKWIQKK